jgi:hypothetical protein
MNWPSPYRLSLNHDFFRNFDHLAGDFGQVIIPEVREEDSSSAAGEAHDVGGIPLPSGPTLDKLVPV